jgi:hypothetical protein
MAEKKSRRQPDKIIREYADWNHGSNLDRTPRWTGKDDLDWVKGSYADLADVFKYDSIKQPPMVESFDPFASNAQRIAPMKAREDGGRIPADICDVLWGEVRNLPKVHETEFSRYLYGARIVFGGPEFEALANEKGDDGIIPGQEYRVMSMEESMDTGWLEIMDERTGQEYDLNMVLLKFAHIQKLIPMRRRPKVKPERRDRVDPFNMP